MRSSRLAHRLPRGSSWSPAARGDQALQRAGYVLELGPGLVAGSPLFERVLARVEVRLVAAVVDCGVVPVSLPASEGEALVNLFAQLGWAGLDAGVLALGTGFREQVEATVSLAALALYRRLDVVRKLPSGQAPAAGIPVPALLTALSALGLPGVALDEHGTLAAPAAPATPGAPAALGTPAAPGTRLGRCRALPLPAEAGEGIGLLVELDLHAVVAALAERHHDERGLLWPLACAPFDLALCPVGPGPEAAAVAAKLEPQLQAAGLEVLFVDDAADATGARTFAERLGLPWRVLCGKTAAGGEVVVEARSGARPERVEVAALCDWLLVRARPESAMDASAATLRRRRTARY